MSTRLSNRKRSISSPTSASSRARSVRWKSEPEQRTFDPDTVIPDWEGEDDDKGEDQLEMEMEGEEEGISTEKEKRVSRLSLFASDFSRTSSVLKAGRRQ